MSDIPRYRHPSFWTGRTVRFFGLTLILLAVVRLAWGHHLSSRVEAEWAEAKQRGEPITAADFKLSDVTPANNAWTFQQKASAAAVAGVDSFRTSYLEGTNTPPYGPKWLQLAEGSESVHGLLFALARQARAFPAALLQDKFDLARGRLNLPSDIGSANHLSQLLADGAQLMEVRGKHIEAVERVRDLLHVARSIRQYPLLVSQLVALRIDSLACESAQIIAPGLNLAADHPEGVRTRKAVNGLIADLLDDSALVDSIRGSLSAERLMIAQIAHAEGDLRYFIRPLADRTILRGHIRMTFAIQAVSAPDARAAEAIVDQMPDEFDELVGDESTLGKVLQGPRSHRIPRYSRLFIRDILFSYRRLVSRHFQTVAERRMTAVILAAHLFRTDHHRWPEKLDELIPAYLPAIPRDPFREGNPPIGYVILRKALPDGTDRPLVYCEPSETDDEDPDHWHSPIYGWQEGTIYGRKTSGPVRQYRDLARFRFPDVPIKEIGIIVPRHGGGFTSDNATEPSSEGVDDDPKKSDAPGKDPEK